MVAAGLTASHGFAVYLNESFNGMSDRVGKGYRSVFLSSKYFLSFQESRQQMMMILSLCTLNYTIIKGCSSDVTLGSKNSQQLANVAATQCLREKNQ